MSEDFVLCVVSEAAQQHIVALNHSENISTENTEATWTSRLHENPVMLGVTTTLGRQRKLG